MSDSGSCTIRAYGATDRADVIRLWATVFPNDPPRNAPEIMIRNKERVQPELFLVASEGEALVGAVMAGYDGTRGWIYHLAVHPDRRRQGIGRALVRAVERGLREAGCPKVNLQVRATNSDVVAFYRSLGYAVEERVSMGKAL